MALVALGDARGRSPLIYETHRDVFLQNKDGDII